MAINNRLAALEQLSEQVPVLNQRAAKQQEEAQRMALQAQVLRKAPTEGTTTTAQKVAPQITKATAAPGIQAQQKTQQQQAELAKTGLKELQSQKQMQAKQMEMNIDQDLQNKAIEQSKKLSEYGIDQDNRLLNFSLEQRQALFELDKDVREKVFNSRKRFFEDEVGRKFSNARQYADWALTTAESDQEFFYYTNQMKIAHRSKLNMLNALYKRMESELKSEHKMATTTKTIQHKKKIAKMKRNLERKIQEEKRQSAWLNAIITGGLTVLGATLTG